MADLIYSVLPRPRRAITYVGPDLTIEECVDLMTKEDIGALVVCNGSTILGMISERDIIRNCLEARLDPAKTRVSDIIFPNVSLLDINDPVEKAMEVITRTKRRHVLVTEEGHLIAILSIGDLLYHLLEDKMRVIEHLENYIHM